MKEEINKKLDDLICKLDKSELIVNIEKLKNKLNNKEILDKIEKLRTLDPYSKEFQELKIKLFENSDFVSYKELENELNYLILEINQRLNKLTDKKECI